MYLSTGPTPSTPATSSPASLSPAPPSVTPTASVGTASPVPVVVVDDPGANCVDWAGLLFSVLAGITSIYLAWQAVRIGKHAAGEAERANAEASKARAAVAAERRRVFELEVLRDLAEALDADHPQIIEIAASPQQMRLYFGSRLALLPEADLPLWREVSEMDSPDDLERRLDLVGQTAPGWAGRSVIDQHQIPHIASTTLSRFLLADLMNSIRERVQARDD